MADVVISFAVPDHIFNGHLSNERHEAERAFMSFIAKQIEERTHIPSLIMQGEDGLRLNYDGVKIGTIKLEYT